MLFPRVRSWTCIFLCSVFWHFFCYMLFPSVHFIAYVRSCRSPSAQSKLRMENTKKIDKCKTLNRCDCFSILTVMTVYSRRLYFNRMFCLVYVTISYSLPTFSQNPVFRIIETAVKKSVLCKSISPDFQLLSSATEPTITSFLLSRGIL